MTLTAVDKLDAAGEKPSRESCVVISWFHLFLSLRHAHLLSAGPSGSGKSFTLLQAVEYCVAKNWIVLYIPRGVLNSLN